MTTTVTDEIAEIFERAGTRGYLHAVEVGTTSPEVAVAADEPVVTASVFKIFVLIAFVRAVDAGTIDPSERTTVTSRYRTGGIGMAGFSDDVTVSWRDLALVMMSMSDNAATDTLYHRLGGDAVNDVIRDLGLARTRLIGCCEDLFRSALDDLGVTEETDLEEFFATLDPRRLGQTAIVDPARTSASTAREITATVTALWTDAIASPSACAAARAIMAQQIWPHRLSSGFPAGVAVAAKTGTVPTWRNEAGVVTYPDGRQFAVAVFTQAWDDADRQPAIDSAIGQAAFAAIEHLRTLTPTPL